MVLFKFFNVRSFKKTIFQKTNLKFSSSKGDENSDINLSLKEFINELRVFNNEQRVFNKRVDTFIIEQSAFNIRLEKKFSSFGKALGKNFEKYNKAVLFLLNSDKNITTSYLIMGKKFLDPNGTINPSNKEIEVDIFCESPLIISECTSFVDSNELNKNKKFVNTIKFIENQLMKESKKYFFCYDIHDDIKDECIDIFKKNNITLVTI